MTLTKPIQFVAIKTSTQVAPLVAAVLYVASYCSISATWNMAISLRNASPPQPPPPAVLSVKVIKRVHKVEKSVMHIHGFGPRLH